MKHFYIIMFCTTTFLILESCWQSSMDVTTFSPYNPEFNQLQITTTLQKAIEFHTEHAAVKYADNCPCNNHAVTLNQARIISPDEQSETFYVIIHYLFDNHTQWNEKPNFNKFHAIAAYLVKPNEEARMSDPDFMQNLTPKQWAEASVNNFVSDNLYMPATFANIVAQFRDKPPVWGDRS